MFDISIRKFYKVRESYLKILIMPFRDNVLLFWTFCQIFTTLNKEFEFYNKTAKSNVKPNCTAVQIALSVQCTVHNIYSVDTRDNSNVFSSQTHVFTNSALNSSFDNLNSNLNINITVSVKNNQIANNTVFNNTVFNNKVNISSSNPTVITERDYWEIIGQQAMAEYMRETQEWSDIKWHNITREWMVAYNDNNYVDYELGDETTGIVRREDSDKVFAEKQGQLLLRYIRGIKVLRFLVNYMSVAEYYEETNEHQSIVYQKLMSAIKEKAFTEFNQYYWRSGCLYPILPETIISEFGRLKEVKKESIIKAIAITQNDFNTYVHYNTDKAITEAWNHLRRCRNDNVTIVERFKKEVKNKLITVGGRIEFYRDYTVRSVTVRDYGYYIIRTLEPALIAMRYIDTILASEIEDKKTAEYWKQGDSKGIRDDIKVLMSEKLKFADTSAFINEALCLIKDCIINIDGDSKFQVFKIIDLTELEDAFNEVMTTMGDTPIFINISKKKELRDEFIKQLLLHAHLCYSCNGNDTYEKYNYLMMRIITGIIARNKAVTKYYILAKEKSEDEKQFGLESNNMKGLLAQFKRKNPIVSKDEMKGIMIEIKAELMSIISSLFTVKPLKSEDKVLISIDALRLEYDLYNDGNLTDIYNCELSTGIFPKHYTRTQLTTSEITVTLEGNIEQQSTSTPVYKTVETVMSTNESFKSKWTIFQENQNRMLTAKKNRETEGEHSRQEEEPLSPTVEGYSEINFTETANEPFYGHDFDTKTLSERSSNSKLSAEEMAERKKRIEEYTAKQKEKPRPKESAPKRAKKE